MDSTTKKLYTALGIIFIFLVWYISSIIIDNEIILPKIDAVFKALVKILGEKKTYLIIFSTLLRLLITIAISFIIGLSLGILSIKFSKVYAFLSPNIAMFRSIPVVSIIIILLIIFGSNLAPIIITSLVVLPIIYEGVYTSFKSIDKSLIDDITTISDVNIKVIKDVYMPMTKPYIISSLVTSFGFGFKVMVMSEFISQPNNSMGKVILYNREMLNMDVVFAWTLIIIFLVILFESILKKVKQTGE